jgi:hypothetical protein
MRSARGRVAAREIGECRTSETVLFAGDIVQKSERLSIGGVLS